MGGHCISESSNLDVLNFYPEAFREITSNACLSTSAFLAPALQDAMEELRPTLKRSATCMCCQLPLRKVASGMLHTAFARALASIADLTLDP